MQFKVCAVCRLSLPISVMQPIQVKDNSNRIITVGICNNCYTKKVKEAESKRNKNEN